MDKLTSKFRFRYNNNESDYKARNILPLEQRVAVLHEFDRNPVYQHLATKFNCSAKQIKTIVANRKQIERLQPDAKPSKSDSVSEEAQRTMIMRQHKRKEKIIFLNAVIYEFLQRATYHQKQLDPIIMLKMAEQVKETIAIENFRPYTNWLEDFMRAHHIKSFNLSELRAQFNFNSPKAASLRCLDLIEYVREQELKLRFSKEQENENQRTIASEVEEIKPNPSSIANPSLEAVQPPSITYEINNDADALKCLNALQDYVLLQDNYRAIGLLTQLEYALKNPPGVQDFEVT